MRIMIEYRSLSPAPCPPPPLRLTAASYRFPSSIYAGGGAPKRARVRTTSKYMGSPVGVGVEIRRMIVVD